MIQFLLDSDKGIKDKTEQHPHVPLLGGRHTKSKNKRIRRRLAMHQKDDEQVPLGHVGSGPGLECHGGGTRHGGAASSHQIPQDPASPESLKRPREHDTPRRTDNNPLMHEQKNFLVLRVIQILNQTVIWNMNLQIWTLKMHSFWTINCMGPFPNPLHQMLTSR